MQYLGEVTKTIELSVCFEGKPFSMAVIQVYAQPWQRSWSWAVLWRPMRPSRTNTNKRCPFHYRGMECKSRKSGDIWNVWPWSTKWSREKANRVLPRKCTGHSKHPFPTIQQMILHMGITRWSILISDWLFSLQLKMEKLYTVSKNKTGRWLWLRSWTPVAKCRVKWRK